MRWPGALQIRDFRVYFFGQLISIIGTFTQLTAQSWLIYSLTQSAFWVGLATAIGFSPMLFFTIFGGEIADRFDRRKLLIISQVGQMCAAFLIAGVIFTGTATVYMIIPLIFLLGLFAAIDLPAQQAYVTDLVGIERLTAAVSLNAAMLQGGRIIGPVVAGMLIALLGVGWAFLVNGVSFLAVIVSLLLIKTKQQHRSGSGSPLQNIKAGLLAVKRNERMLDLIIMGALGPLFAFSMGTLAPATVSGIYHRDAASLGIMMGASGLGAFIAALSLSKLSDRYEGTSLVVSGNIVMACCLIAMHFASFWMGVALFMLSSFCFVASNSTSNVLIQRLADPSMRGRVLSVWSIASFGMFPIGALISGVGGELMGPLNLFLLNGVVFLVCIGALVMLRPGLRSKGGKNLPPRELASAEGETAKFPEI